jgi:hypothetical protein
MMTWALGDDMSMTLTSPIEPSPTIPLLARVRPWVKLTVETSGTTVPPGYNLTFPAAAGAVTVVFEARARAVSGTAHFPVT